MATRARTMGGICVAAGVAIVAASTGLASAGVEPFPTWLYHFAWYGTLVALWGGLARRDGGPPTGVGEGVSLLFWSAVFWYVYELLNLRLANWYYVLVPEGRMVRWTGTFVAFATVLPALRLAYGWMERRGLAEGWRRPRFRVRGGQLAALAGGGMAFLALALWRPAAFFPLVWGAVTLLLEPWNWSRDPGSSLFGDLARGRYARIVQLLAGGLVIGLLWEGFNWAAGARWIYTVPGLERFKLFEMPFPGFLGFPVLALDGYVAYRALAHLGVAAPGWDEGDPPAGEARAGGGRTVGLRPGRAAVAAIAALLFCGTVQAGVDRWTVDSMQASLEALPAVSPSDAEVLRGVGLDRPEELAAADSSDLARRTGWTADRAGEVVRAARLASLRGLGAAHAESLWRAGVRSRCDLAAQQADRVSDVVGAGARSPRSGRPARVRVWLQAARAACPAGSEASEDAGSGRAPRSGGGGTLRGGEDGPGDT